MSLVPEQLIERRRIADGARFQIGLVNITQRFGENITGCFVQIQERIIAAIGVENSNHP